MKRTNHSSKRQGIAIDAETYKAIREIAGDTMKIQAVPRLLVRAWNMLTPTQQLKARSFQPREHVTPSTARKPAAVTAADHVSTAAQTFAEVAAADADGIRTAEEKARIRAGIDHEEAELQELAAEIA